MATYTCPPTPITANINEIISKVKKQLVSRPLSSKIWYVYLCLCTVLFPEKLKFAIIYLFDKKERIGSGCHEQLLSSLKPLLFINSSRKRIPTQIID